MAHVAKITNRGKVRYRLRWTDEFGKSHSKLFEKKRLANDALTLLQQAEEEGTPLGAIDLYVDELMEKFMEAARLGARDNREPLSPQTLRGYQGYIDRTIGPKFGDMQVAEIDTPRARAMRDELLQAFEVRRSAQQCLMVMKSAFTYALERGWITANPFTSVTIKLVRMEVDVTGDNPDLEEEVIMLSRDEVAALRKSAYFLRDDHRHSQVRAAWLRYAAMFLCLLTSGLRSGEMRALRWRDVDFEKKEIRVRRSADSATCEIIPTKGKRRRTVPASAEFLEALEAFRPDDPSESIFAGTVSGTIPPHSHLYKHFWQRLLKHAEVRPYGMHALRHYFASRLIADNIDIKRVSVWMGHSTVAFTLDQYGHLMRKEERDGFEEVKF